MERERLAALAGRQYGLFTSRQAVAAGVSARQIESGTQAGRWQRVYRGVYRMAGVPATTEQAVLAAVLASGKGAMASHRAAAWVWGLADEPVLEVSGPVHRRPAPGVIIYHRQGTPVRPVPRRRIPCTDPLRTIVDLAGLGDTAVLERALDKGVASGLVSTAAVEAELGRRAGKGVAGVELLRAGLAGRLDRGSPYATSVLESEMDRLIVRLGVPLPERQYWVPGTRYRLDYAYPGVRLYLEVDGYAERAGLDPFRHDRRRQNDLSLLGWMVLRFTWDQVRYRPEAVAAAVVQALADRGAVLV